MKPWLELGENFIFEKDKNLGYKSGKSNIVRDWKDEHNLKSYFNCNNSLDFSPIKLK